PFVLLSECITHFFSSNHQPMTVSREEVSAMVNVGAEEGVLATKENRMIQNLLKLDDIKARDIMTPSSVVEMAEESMTLREFYRHDAYSTYSRIPVYNEENDDFIKGYVLRQTILEKLSEDKFELRLTDIVRPVLTFQENEPVSKIWEKLLAKKEHISVIIDEYGCFRGIVTMEDVIETMLGTEIVDEKDTVTDMQELAREKWQEQQEALQG
ncbi:MAG: CBS domain-containing protein, partial [Prevotellamassilia sp.]|nr:CBS domain-containing protein [Prevotellamassilia sp.]